MLCLEKKNGIIFDKLIFSVVRNCVILQEHGSFSKPQEQYRATDATAGPIVDLSALKTYWFHRY
jgi:hypothetical protein